METDKEFGNILFSLAFEPEHIWLERIKRTFGKKVGFSNYGQQGEVSSKPKLKVVSRLEDSSLNNLPENS